MSFDEGNRDEQWTPPPPPGMSGTAKLFVGCAVGCAGMVLLGVMAVIALVMTFGTKAIHTDPATVRKVQAEITPLEIPAGLQPMASFQPRFLQIAWVLYADRSTHSTLVLNSSADWRGDDLPRAKAMVERTVQSEQVGLSRERLQQRRVTQRIVTIGGKPIPFVVTTGQGTDSKTERISVLGMFPGRAHWVLLMFDGDATHYPETQLAKMLESIGREPPAAPPRKAP
jgi:hypothetical protein